MSQEEHAIDSEAIADTTAAETPAATTEYDAVQDDRSVDIFLGANSTTNDLHTAYASAWDTLMMRDSYSLEPGAGNPIQAFPGGIYVVHGINISTAPADTVSKLQALQQTPPAFMAERGTYSLLLVDSGRSDVRDGVSPVDLLRIVLNELKSASGDSTARARDHLVQAIDCFTD